MDLTLDVHKVLSRILLRGEYRDRFLLYESLF